MSLGFKMLRSNIIQKLNLFERPTSLSDLLRTIHGVLQNPYDFLSFPMKTVLFFFLLVHLNPTNKLLLLTVHFLPFSSSFPTCKRTI